MKIFKPKLNFITTPTKLEEMVNLRKEIGCKPRLFIKRDDLTEVGLGGNKNRKLEYVMYDAWSQGANCIITWAGEQSNHIRQTIAYAIKLGMEAHVVINGQPKPHKQGNMFLFDLLGAKTYYEEEGEKCPQKCEEVARLLIEKGKIPYIVPIGASIPLGNLGYIECAKEIAKQSKKLGIKPGAVFVPSGSAGTQAGLEVGVRLFMPYSKVYGISVSRGKELQQDKVANLVNETATYLSLKKVNVKSGDICIYDNYFGGKYAVPTTGGIEAIKLLGRTEAIILDPVYSGKAMDAMLDLLKKGELDSYESVVFVHTGGSPAIYNFTQYFENKE